MDRKHPVRPLFAPLAGLGVLSRSAAVRAQVEARCPPGWDASRSVSTSDEFERPVRGCVQAAMELSATVREPAIAARSEEERAIGANQAGVSCGGAQERQGPYESVRIGAGDARPHSPDRWSPW